MNKLICKRVRQSDSPVIVITGPTASGKTAIAVKLAKELDGEIVGADSMQIYKDMNIGTATPDSCELEGVTHHMLNIVTPDTSYDVAEFCRDADICIADILNRGKRVIVAGGTGMYIRVLLKGIHEAPPPDLKIRGNLTKRADHEGWPALHRELVLVDKAAALRIHPNDGVRIVRALEVYLQTGKTMSQWQEEHGFLESRYNYLMLGAGCERAVLNDRINKRVDFMIEAGFVDEVKYLLKAGYDSSIKPMQALGYKRVVQFLNRELTFDEMVENIKTDTRRFAKRQRTWFKKEPVEWFDNFDEFKSRSELFLFEKR